MLANTSSGAPAIPSILKVIGKVTQLYRTAINLAQSRLLTLSPLQSAGWNASAIKASSQVNDPRVVYIHQLPFFSTHSHVGKQPICAHSQF